MDEQLEEKEMLEPHVHEKRGKKKKVNDKANTISGLCDSIPRVNKL